MRFRCCGTSSQKTLPILQCSSSPMNNDFLLVTCNRDDLLELAKQKPYHGIIIVVRRKTRAAERSGLFHLLERAGENGLKNNINFA